MVAGRQYPLTGCPAIADLFCVEMISRHEAVVSAYLYRRVGRSVAEELLAGALWVMFG